MQHYSPSETTTSCFAHTSECSTLRSSGRPNSPAYLFGRVRLLPSLVVSTSGPAQNTPTPTRRRSAPSVPLSFARPKKGLRARPGINVMQFNVYVNQTRGYHRGDYPAVLPDESVCACVLPPGRTCVRRRKVGEFWELLDEVMGGVGKERIKTSLEEKFKYSIKWHILEWNFS